MTPREASNWLRTSYGPQINTSREIADLIDQLAAAREPVLGEVIDQVPGDVRLGTPMLVEWRGRLYPGYFTKPGVQWQGREDPMCRDAKFYLDPRPLPDAPPVKTEGECLELQLVEILTRNGFCKKEANHAGAIRELAELVKQRSLT